MLSYVILVILQFAAGFIGAPQLLRYVPVSGDAQNYALAAAYAVIVWIVGLLASLVLKSVRRPSAGALGLALALALAGAAVIQFAPGVLAASPVPFPALYLPLLGAILGYLIRR